MSAQRLGKVRPRVGRVRWERGPKGGDLSGNLCLGALERLTGAEGRPGPKPGIPPGIIVD